MSRKEERKAGAHGHLPANTPAGIIGELRKEIQLN
jgi:hypothetical protein